MTFCRAIPWFLVGLLLITGPGPATVAQPVVAMPTTPEEEDGGGATELTLTLDALHHARRPNGRLPNARRSAVIPPHRHHAVLVRSQAAPVSFQAAAHSPLRC